MGEFRKYLERQQSGLGHHNEVVDKLEADTGEFLKHAVHSMLAEGQEPSAIYRKALPIFGEEFLIEAGIVDVVVEASGKDK